MQRVQSFICTWIPLSSVIVVFWTFGFHVRRVRFFAWLTLFPNDGFLPHSWHFAMINQPPRQLPSTFTTFRNILNEEYTTFAHGSQPCALRHSILANVWSPLPE